MTILRDGRVVRTAPAAEQTESKLIQGMLGRSLGAAFPARRVRRPMDAPAVLSVSDLRAPGVNGVSLEVRAGEIVGLAGLVGAGRTELARAIFGAERASAGSVELAGGRSVGRPAAEPARGPGDDPRVAPGRGAAAAALGHGERQPGQPARGQPARLRPRRAERARARGARPLGRAQRRLRRARRLAVGRQPAEGAVRAHAAVQPARPIADEPTRGVDVGARRAIYDLLAALAEDGMGVLFVSSELEELLGLAHRILVMRAGRIVAELAGDEMTESAVLAAAFASRGAAGGA